MTDVSKSKMTDVSVDFDKWPRSVPVPKLYKVAANVYRDFNEGKDSVKNLVYQSKRKHPNIRAIMAIVIEALNHKNLLDSALEEVDFFTKEPRFQKDLAIILFTELFFGKKTLGGDSIPITTALKYKNKIKKHLEGEVSLDKEREVVKFPKYARVNTLCNSLVRVSRALREDGWLEVMYDKDTVAYNEFLKMMKNLKENEYLVDYHIPNLLVFPPKTQLYDHHFVEDGSLLLQDKGSCMPVAALSPPPGSCVLDACAAPGMKTSQLASMVCGTWVAVLGGKPPPGAKVYAVERSTKRCHILNDILSKSKADKVTTVINQNFLEINPEDYSDVEYIIVDPSCSGDGMVNRNSMAGSEVTAEKLEKLVFFQKKILSHALSFPSVKKVAYSTCSLSKEEDEGVLEDILGNNHNWKLVRALDSWERRGKGEDYSNCARTDPHQDLCNGFFVSVLERCTDEEFTLNGEQKVKKKKDKKIKLDEPDNTSAVEETLNCEVDEVKPEKKKKRKKDKIEKESDLVEESDIDQVKPEKKKKKRDKSEKESDVLENEGDQNSSVKKKKKKKDKVETEESESVTQNDVENGSEVTENKSKYGRMKKGEREEKQKEEYCTTS